MSGVYDTNSLSSEEGEQLIPLTSKRNHVQHNETFKFSKFGDILVLSEEF